MEYSLPLAFLPGGHGAETDTPLTMSFSRCRNKQRIWSEISEDTHILGTLRVLTQEVPGLKESGSVIQEPGTPCGCGSRKQIVGMFAKGDSGPRTLRMAGVLD